MSKETNVTTGGGIGFFGLLAILFIGLKLAAIGPVATWSWWWVLSPLWAPLVLILGIAFIGLIISGILYLIFKR